MHRASAPSFTATVMVDAVTMRGRAGMLRESR